MKFIHERIIEKIVEMLNAKHYNPYTKRKVLAAYPVDPRVVDQVPVNPNVKKGSTEPISRQEK